MPYDLQFNPDIDPLGLQATFLAQGRIQVPGIFTSDTAEYLYELLIAHKHWYLAYNEGQNFYENSLEDFLALEPVQQHRFMNRIYGRARDQFQYVFNQYYITQAIEHKEQPNHPMHQMHAFMNSEPVLAFMRELTGQQDVCKADSYASLYRPGHFLTEHEDLHDKHDRVAAYVFSMTKAWSYNWGGHLAFFDELGNIEEAFLPSFNTLNIFLIPKKHAVQLVAPYAGSVRTSYLGWLQR
jgi:Rps23 Pro-64 3,4-dihydroxylase Tpa1-like proline 4-hydroxylase